MPPCHFMAGAWKQEDQRATYRAPEYNVPLFDWLARVAILFFRLAGKKRKRGRGHWDLAWCQVSLNSVQWFKRRSQKCLSQSEARVAILFFQSAPITQTWKRTLRSCFLSILLNSVQRFQRRSRKCLSQSEARVDILIFWSARSTQTW